MNDILLFKDRKLSVSRRILEKQIVLERKKERKKEKILMFFEPPLPPRIEFLFHDLFSFNPIDKYLGGGGQVPDAERVEVKVVRGTGGAHRPLQRLWFRPPS